MNLVASGVVEIFSPEKTVVGHSSDVQRARATQHLVCHCESIGARIGLTIAPGTAATMCPDERTARA